MRTLHILLGAVLVGTPGLALPQTSGAAGGAQASDPNVQGGAEGDSGAGLQDEAAKWVGAEVVTSDGKSIGKVKSVLPSAPNSDAGELVVTPAAGGADLEVPLRGASYDGTRVSITSTEAEATAPR